MPDPNLSIVEGLLVDIRPEFYHIPVKPILPNLSMFFYSLTTLWRSTRQPQIDMSLTSPLIR